MICEPGSLAILFALLTASRIGNVVGSYGRIRTQAARWADLDRPLRLWTIPASDMKAGRYGGTHVVPLSNEARSLLLLAQAWQDCHGHSEFVFTMKSTARLTYPRLYAAFKEICAKDRNGFFDPETKDEVHIHGLRSTFKTWSTNHGFDFVLTEIALHHTIDKLHYDRAKAISRRKKLMQAWADFCFSATPKDWFEQAVVQVSQQRKNREVSSTKDDPEVLKIEMTNFPLLTYEP